MSKLNISPDRYLKMSKLRKENTSPIEWVDRANASLDIYIERTRLLLESEDMTQELDRPRFAAFHNFRSQKKNAEIRGIKLINQAHFLESFKLASKLNNEVIEKLLQQRKIYLVNSKKLSRSSDLIHSYRWRAPIYQLNLGSM